MEKKISLNRKNTKIEYLSREVKELKEEIDNLNMVISLNKQALKISL